MKHPKRRPGTGRSRANRTAEAAGAELAARATGQGARLHASLIEGLLALACKGNRGEQASEKDRAEDGLYTGRHHD